MNPRIRLTSAKIEVGVEVEAELGKKLIPSRAHKKTRKSHILGTYEKKCDFHLLKVSLVTISGGNGHI